jgi:release factor glutamine methyltransferase
MTTARQALEAARRRLEPASTSPMLDAELLLASTLGIARGRLLAEDERRLTPEDLAQLEALVARRAAGEPIAYLTGRRGFWSQDLLVTPAVLVPRPETELLVELALARMAGRTDPAVLDLGTGSGAVAIAIASERPDSRVTAVDQSEAALDVARGNAAAAGIGNIELLAGHWFEPVAGRRFDVVVANPPYLAEGDPHLPALVHEPRSALVAGPTGLEAIAEILAGTPAHLAPGGWLAVEHGYGQAQAVRVLFEQSGLVRVATHQDLAGLDRATLGCRPAQEALSG